MHFCGGELASLKMMEKQLMEDSCTCGVMAEDDGSCCKNEIKVFKTDDNLKSSFDFAFKNVAAGDIWLIAPLLFLANVSFKTLIYHNFTFHLPQSIPPPKTPIWLFINVLRI